MKLLNRSFTWLSLSIIVILGSWSVVLYFNTISEIKDSVDEGLENYKRHLIAHIEADSVVKQKTSFDEGLFTLTEIPKARALRFHDRYLDTEMDMQDDDDEFPEAEPVRMLITAFEHKDRYYKLSIVNSMVEEDDLVEEFMQGFLVLAIVLIFALLIINNLVLRRLWQPFYSLLDQLKAFRLGKNEKLPSVETDTTEFVDLCETLDVLLTHSKNVFARQKEFIGNASHELQTPLAIVRNKLELLLEKTDIGEQDAMQVQEVLSIIDRLSRLNKSLLLLTKIENRQFADNEDVLLNELATDLLAELEPLTAHKKLEVVVRSDEKVHGCMNRSLAEIIVSNLIRNAIGHNEEGGKIEIGFSENEMSICNTGSAVPLDETKVFSRFYKAEQENTGSGLGLAIVHAIAGLYGFAVAYQFENGMHCFRLSLAPVV